MATDSAELAEGRVLPTSAAPVTNARNMSLDVWVVARYMILHCMLTVVDGDKAYAALYSAAGETDKGSQVDLFFWEKLYDGLGRSM